MAKKEAAKETKPKESSDSKKKVSLSDLGDDPSLVQSLNKTDAKRLLKEYEDGAPLAGTLAQELTAKLSEFGD